MKLIQPIIIMYFLVPFKTIAQSYVLPNETVIFSFSTQNGKIATLNKEKNNHYIVYRFGTRNKTEFEYSDTTKDSWTKFTYSFYCDRSGLDFDFRHDPKSPDGWNGQGTFRETEPTETGCECAQRVIAPRSFSRFSRLAIEDSIPDATTLWLFHEKLAKGMRAHPNCNLDHLTELLFEFDQTGKIIDCVGTIKDGGQYRGRSRR